MKIAYCIGATHNSGGMERVLANKANYLVSKGYEVSIITSDQEGKQPFFPIDARVRQYDLGIGYSANNGKGLINKLLNFPLKQRLHKQRLRSLLKQIQPDITISMFDSEASFLWQLSEGGQKVVEIHFSRFKRLQYMRSGLWGWIDRYRTRLDAKTVSKYRQFVVLTNEDKGYWGNMPNICVIPNANTFEVDKTTKLEHQKAIAVGRLEHQKGFEDMIDAWHAVHQIHPDWTLHIYGEGKLRESLQQQIDRLGLSKVVFLEQPVQNIVEKYLDSSILLMTSRYEGLPMSLLEGQACGLPMVSYTCKCGPKDIITDGENGFLIPEGGIQTMAKKVCTLIEDADLRKQMGQKSKDNSVKFSEVSIMKKWEQLFNQIVATK